MPRINLSVLLLLSVGALQTLAVTPRIQLEIGTDASGCINVGGCSYGCGKISPSTAEKNILTPLCPTGEVLPEYPQQITIRGKPEAPHLFDEGRGDVYRCIEVGRQSKRFICRHRNRKMIQPSASENVSSSSVASLSVASSSAHVGPSTSAVSTTSSWVSVHDASATRSKAVAVASATSEPYVCQYISEIMGKGSGLGNLDDCCTQNDDCHGSCINGACDSENNIPTETWNDNVSLPSPSTCSKKSVVYDKRQGLGNLGDCCVNSDDCRGACIGGICNAENNVPISVCTNDTYKGRRNGKGPKGVCCNTQADCQESCDRGVCTGP